MSDAVAPVLAPLGWALLHSLWQGCGLAGLLAVLLRVLRHASPARRHALACATLLLMVVLPAVTAWRAPVAERESAPAVSVLAPDTMIAAHADAPPLRIAEWLPGAVRRAAGTATRTLVPSLHGARAPLERVLPLVALAWLVGVALRGARLAGGWALARRLVRVDASPAPGAWQRRLDALRRELGVQRAVRLLLSARVSVPTMVGWLRPVILLPLGALSGLPVAQLELLLRHELAHVRRHDYLVNALQCVAEVLLFHHPAAWWVSRRIREEREHCCDDLAVRGGDAMAYARALLAAEEARRAPATGALALGADGGTLVARVRRLLDPPARAPRRRQGQALLPLVATTALLAGLLALARPAAQAAPPTAARGALDADSRCTPTADSLTLCAPLMREAGALLAAAGVDGVVVVQDVATGALLAYASASRDGHLGPTSAAVPASVWKLAVASLWWEHGLPDAPLPCPATLRVGTRTVRDAAGGRGALSPEEVLVHSCNTAAAEMTLRLRATLGAEGVLAGLQRLGFPAATRDDAAERDSTFWATASPSWRARMSPARHVLRLAPDAPDEAWAELALGFPRVHPTPLHLSRFLQAVGHDGVMRRPTVERAELARADSGVRILSAGTARRLQRAMRGVVERGTARGVQARLAGARYTLGGKTGTTDGGARRADGWFAGLVFDEHGTARYTVVTYLRGGGPGGGAPARLAADLARWLGGAAAAHAD